MATVDKLQKTKWQALQESVACVADEWNDEVSLEGAPGTRHMYLSMANKVIDLFLRDDTFKWPSQWVEEAEEIHVSGKGLALADGFRVLAFHIHNGSFTAGVAGRNDEDIEDILMHPQSFEPLRAITHETSKIAGRVETEYGLQVTSYSDKELIMLNRYAIRGGALHLNELKYEIMKQRMNAFSNEDYEKAPDNDLARCRAERAKVLEPIFHDMTRIALKDQRLVVASLQQGREFAQSTKS